MSITIKMENVIDDIIHDPYLIKYVLKYVSKRRGYNIIKKVAQINGYILQYVPDSFLTDEIKYLCISSCGLSIQFIPRDEITEELALLALKSNIHSIEFIPEEIITDEMIKIVRDNGQFAYSLPRSKITNEMIIEDINKCGSNALAGFHYLSRFRYGEPIITQEMVLLAKEKDKEFEEEWINKKMERLKDVIINNIED